MINKKEENAMFYLPMAWDLDSFLKNLGTSMQGWGALLVFVIGTAMVIAAAYFIGKGLMSHGRGQTNWAMTILLLIVGGAFMAAGGGGWALLTDIAEGSKQTIDKLGSGGTILLHGFMSFF